ncbi:hypothetical protein OKW43_004358 [Paraburkholderia sp. WC7.3g]
MRKSRRTFMTITAGIASGLALSRIAFADEAMVSEADSTSLALGYRIDAANVDKTKYAKYAAGQVCRNCAFYQCVRSVPDFRRQAGGGQGLV